MENALLDIEAKAFGSGPPMRRNCVFTAMSVWIYSGRHGVHRDVSYLVYAVAVDRDVKGAVAVIVSTSVATTWRADHAS
jgi:hypothetical protein